jgi:predicted dehydrogenase
MTLAQIYPDMFTQSRSRIIRIGVIGINRRGITYCRLIEPRSNARVTAIADISREAWQRAQKDEVIRALERHSDFRFTEDYRSVLNDPAVDAVIIATPDSTHMRLGIDAIQSGKAVLCEKPLEVEPAKLLRLYKTAKEHSHVVFGVGLVLRYAPFFRQIKTIISRGDIGKVRFASVMDHVGKGGYYFFHSRQYRRRDHVTSLLVEKGCHSIDLLNWFVGSRPVRVCGFAGRNVFGGTMADDMQCPGCELEKDCIESYYNIRRTRGIPPQDEPGNLGCVFAKEIDIDDHAALSIAYENGAHASYNECHYTAQYKRVFTIVGDEGTIEADTGDDRDPNDNRIVIMRRHRRDVTTICVPDPDTLHMGGDQALIDDFIHAVGHPGHRVLADVDAGYWATLLPLAADQAAHRGVVVDLDEFTKCQA